MTADYDLHRPNLTAFDRRETMPTTGEIRPTAADAPVAFLTTTGDDLAAAYDRLREDTQYADPVMVSATVRTVDGGVTMRFTSIVGYSRPPAEWVQGAGDTVEAMVASTLDALRDRAGPTTLAKVVHDARTLGYELIKVGHRAEVVAS